MNILGAMGIGEVIKSVGQIADDLTTSDKERMQADLDAYKAETERMDGQVEINKIEAANSSLFVSGGRPFVVWVCGCAGLRGRDRANGTICRKGWVWLRR